MIKTEKSIFPEALIHQLCLLRDSFAVSVKINMDHEYVARYYPVVDFMKIVPFSLIKSNVLTIHSLYTSSIFKN
ncbi:MAG: hypothetical protein ACYSTS_10635 [Planctomycetota bacterium]